MRSLCCCSVAKSCPTLCNSMDCSPPGFPVPHYLLDFAQVHVQWMGDAIQPSHPLLFPLASCPQSFPASGSFPISQLFASSGQSTGASASASVLPMNVQGLFPLGLTGLISLLPKGLSRVFSSTTVWQHQFFSALSSLWSVLDVTRVGPNLTGLVSLWEEERRTQTCSVRALKGGCHLQGRREPTCQYLDLRLLASRTGGKLILAVLSHLTCGILFWKCQQMNAVHSRGKQLIPSHEDNLLEIPVTMWKALGDQKELPSALPSSLPPSLSPFPLPPNDKPCVQYSWV